MTFRELALAVFPSWEMDDTELARVAAALEHGYIEALKACSWRLGGKVYLFEGRTTMKLSDAIAKVQTLSGPL